MPLHSITPPALKFGGDRFYVARWQRTLLFALPFGVLAFASGWFLEGPSGQFSIFDHVTYPIMAVTLAALWCLLALDKHNLGLVVITIVGGTSAFLLGKLVFLLFFGIEAPSVLAQLTETFFWVPVIYLLSFVLPGVTIGRRIALGFTLVVLALCSVYALWPDHPQRTLGVLYALLQINLANSVLLGLTQAFIGFKEAYTRNQTRMEVAERFAEIDTLTNLPNRFSLQKRVTTSLEVARLRGTQVALLFIDIDGFKTLNDTFGHEAGDLVLKQLAVRLQNVLRKNDFIARISGDEFVLVIEDVEDPQIASFVANKLQAELVAPFHVANQAFNVTVSIGISFFPEDADDVDALLRHADSAMYRVKRSGKNGVQQYRRETDAQLERQRAMERDLRAAIQAQDLTLVYQPIHDLATGEVRKFEALLRWSNPTWGHVSPADFIPIAEASGLIVPLGTWVLHEACRQAKAWQRVCARGVQVSINVSPLQFAQSNFYATVVEALELHGLTPDALELELTESMVLHGVDHVTSTLDRLQRLGVSIAIDDFGTGYSSLAYLRDLPIDTIKIDRSFIKDLGSPRKGPQFSLALVEAITRLAQHLDLDVVAEGIETKAQCDIAKSLGCTAGQGYYFARPMTTDAVDVFLRVTAGEPLRESVGLAN
ncbi:MAG: EAL domain-containing protein [Trueperaceae bacterium]|nr:EAL domain-containing protein [Trueperaceae bacterium]